MKRLTIFTPTYNRAHTIERTYQSLCRQTCKDFEWLVIDDGSTDNTQFIVKEWIKKADLDIKYIFKENGGLYTGYNTAYENISTELNVCIDSDDYMPDDAVELILEYWDNHGSENFAGIVGLDFYHNTNKPIAGYFPNNLKETYMLDLYINNIHRGDAKYVMRTDLMKLVSPQIGFPGEKFFNPMYMLLQVCDDRPLLVLNKNLCFVDYQNDGSSMSKAIFFQYINSPNSFSKQRILEMTLKRTTIINNIRSAIHYVATSIIARDKKWLHNTPKKALTLSVAPLGVLLYLFIKLKTK